MKAGHLFMCVCCKDSHDESEATIDDTLNGPVCEECRRNILWSVAWLKRADIRRPLSKTDINQHNHHRFQ